MTDIVTDAMLAQMRSATEALMGSRVVVSRGGSWSFTGGVEVWQPGETVYTGPALIQERPQSSVVVAGAQNLNTATHVVKLPYVSGSGVLPSDRVDVTDSPDSYYTGRHLTVDGAGGNDFGVCRRIFATMELG